MKGLSRLKYGGRKERAEREKRREQEHEQERRGESRSERRGSLRLTNGGRKEKRVSQIDQRRKEKRQLKLIAPLEILLESYKTIRDYFYLKSDLSDLFSVLFALSSKFLITEIRPDLPSHGLRQVSEPPTTVDLVSLVKPYNFIGDRTAKDDFIASETRGCCRCHCLSPLRCRFRSRLALSAQPRLACCHLVVQEDLTIIRLLKSSSTNKHLSSSYQAWIGYRVDPESMIYWMRGKTSLIMSLH
ncbi:uncharacterized protein LOC144546076 [Carex rostrata]